MTDEQNVAQDRSESGPETVEAVADDARALRLEIELRAYYRYCERGCTPGSEMDDWLAAEQEVLAAHAVSVSSPVKASGDDPGRRGRRQDRARR